MWPLLARLDKAEPEYGFCFEVNPHDEYEIRRYTKPKHAVIVHAEDLPRDKNGKLQTDSKLVSSAYSLFMKFIKSRRDLRKKNQQAGKNKNPEDIHLSVPIIVTGSQTIRIPNSIDYNKIKHFEFKEGDVLIVSQIDPDLKPEEEGHDVNVNVVQTENEFEGESKGANNEGASEVEAEVEAAVEVEAEVEVETEIEVPEEAEGEGEDKVSGEAEEIAKEEVENEETATEEIESDSDNKTKIKDEYEDVEDTEDENRAADESEQEEKTNISLHNETDDAIDTFADLQVEDIDEILFKNSYVGMGIIEETTDIEYEGQKVIFFLSSEIDKGKVEKDSVHGALQFKLIPEGGCEAVVSFSRHLSMANAKKEAEELIRMLEEDEIEVVGGGTWSYQVYTGPFTIPWKRRSEIHIPVFMECIQSGE